MCLCQCSCHSETLHVQVFITEEGAQLGIARSFHIMGWLLYALTKMYSKRGNEREEKLEVLSSLKNETTHSEKTKCTTTASSFFKALLTASKESLCVEKLNNLGKELPTETYNQWLDPTTQQGRHLYNLWQLACGSNHESDIIKAVYADTIRKVRIF